MTAKLRLYTNPSGLAHDTGPGHPESAARLQAVLSVFRQKPFADLPLTEIRDCGPEWLDLAHDPAYIDALADAVPDRGYARLDADTIVSSGSWQAALDAAGCVRRAVDDVMAGLCKRAFCAVRPPGHHAERNRAMGFCLFNTIFIGARYAQERYGLKRIAIVDFDVHHGNGTDAMTRQADGIFYVSTHQFPFYPGTGGAESNIPGKILNIPLKSGSESSEFQNIFAENAIPALKAFAPELLMISAGFDAHKDDPLAALSLTDDDYARITEDLVTIADAHSQGRIVSVLEGGYNLDALKSALAAHIAAML